MDIRQEIARTLERAGVVVPLKFKGTDADFYAKVAGEVLSLQGVWRSIESAPRDGTHIILAFGQDHSSEGWYVDDDSEPRPWCFLDIADFNEVIINRCRDDQYGPSHWQPLPRRGPHPASPAPETKD